MAAHVLRLRLALLLGSVRGDRRIRTLISLAAVIAVTAVVCIAVFSLAAAPVPVARAVTVLGGAATVRIAVLAQQRTDPVRSRHGFTPSRSPDIQTVDPGSPWRH